MLRRRDSGPKQESYYCTVLFLQVFCKFDSTKNKFFLKRVNSVKQKLIELQKKKKAQNPDESTIIFGDTNTPLSQMHRCSRQKTSKEIVELNITISQPDIIKHLQAMPSNNSRMPILLKLTCNIHPDRTHSGS